MQVAVASDRSLMMRVPMPLTVKSSVHPYLCVWAMRHQHYHSRLAVASKFAKPFGLHGVHPYVIFLRIVREFVYFYYV